MAQVASGNRTRTAASAEDRQAGRTTETAERGALVERLRTKAAEADEGKWVSLSGLTDEEIVAALTRR